MKSKSVLSLHAASRKRRSPGGGSITGSAVAAEQALRRCAATASDSRSTATAAPATSRDGSAIIRAVISKKAAPIASGLAMPMPPSPAPAARRKSATRRWLLFGDFGHLPRQLGRIQAVFEARPFRRFSDPRSGLPRRGRSGSARLLCAFRFACPCRSYHLFLRLGSLRPGP